MKWPAAQVQNASVYILYAVAQMRMILVDVTPCFDNSNNRALIPILKVVPDLKQTRAVPECAQIIDT